MQSSEPDPALAAEVEEKMKQVLARLSDDDAEIACLRLEGYSSEEIAGQVGLSPATVRRRLAVIHDVFSEDFGDG